MIHALTATYNELDCSQPLKVSADARFDDFGGGKIIAVENENRLSYKRNQPTIIAPLSSYTLCCLAKETLTFTPWKVSLSVTLKYCANHFGCYVLIHFHI